MVMASVLTGTCCHQVIAVFFTCEKKGNIEDRKHAGMEARHWRMLAGLQVAQQFLRPEDHGEGQQLGIPLW